MKHFVFLMALFFILMDIECVIIRNKKSPPLTTSGQYWKGVSGSNNVVFLIDNSNSGLLYSQNLYWNLRLNTNNGVAVFGQQNELGWHVDGSGSVGFNVTSWIIYRTGSFCGGTHSGVELVLSTWTMGNGQWSRTWYFDQCVNLFIDNTGILSCQHQDSAIYQVKTFTYVDHQNSNNECDFHQYDNWVMENTPNSNGALIGKIISTTPTATPTSGNPTCSSTTTTNLLDSMSNHYTQPVTYQKTVTLTSTQSSSVQNSNSNTLTNSWSFSFSFSTGSGNFAGTTTTVGYSGSVATSQTTTATNENDYQVSTSSSYQATVNPGGTIAIYNVTNMGSCVYSVSFVMSVCTPLTNKCYHTTSSSTTQLTVSTTKQTVDVRTN
jgi:hypothetical protein